MTCPDFKKLCEKHHPNEIDGLTKKAFLEHVKLCPPCHAWLLARLREEETKPPDPMDETMIPKQFRGGIGL